NELLRLAAGVEQHAEHYIAAAVIRKAKSLNIGIPRGENFHYLPGQGIEGKVEGMDVKVVGPNYLRERKIEVAAPAEDTGRTIAYILVDNTLAGYFTFSDQIREESHEAIKTLKAAGIKNLLLTGDNERVAKQVSETLEMDGFMANVLPHEKLEKVESLQAQGEFVAMTG